MVSETPLVDALLTSLDDENNVTKYVNVFQGTDICIDGWWDKNLLEEKLSELFKLKEN